MTSNADRPPRELTDAQLDQILHTANEELLDHVQATADPNRTLSAIMADSSITPAAEHSRGSAVLAVGRITSDPEDGGLRHARHRAARSASPAQRAAILQIRLRARVFELNRALGRARTIADDIRSGRLGTAAAPDYLTSNDTNVDRPSWGRFICVLVFFGIGLGTRWTWDLRGGKGVPFVEITSDAVLAASAFMCMVSATTFIARYRAGKLKGAVNRAVALHQAVQLEPPFPARARGRLTAVVFDVARVVDNAHVRGLNRALHSAARRELHAGANVLIRARAFDIAVTLDLIQDVQQGTAAWPIDASGADLSHVKIKDLIILDGVIWTRQTKWPPRIADQVSKQSDIIREGVYQVHIGDANDRTGLTHV